MLEVVTTRQPPPRRRRLARLLRNLFVTLVLLGLGLFLTLFVIVSREVKREGGTPLDALVFMADPAGYAFGSRNRINILCLGVDYNHTSQGIRYSKGARSDTMMLVSLDRKQRSISVLSIPRDVRVDLGADYGYDKINAAYAVGGAARARKVVGELLDLPVDYTLAVRVEAAKQIIDAMGGLTLDVEKDMDYEDRWGHLFIHLKKGRRKLTGDEVVGYARFRHDEEGDLGRIRRQQQVLAALSRELKKSARRPDMALDMIKILRANTTSDLSFTRMAALARAFAGMDRSQLRTGRLAVADEYIGGVSYLVPLEAENRALVRRLLTSPEDLPLPDIRVEVLNGSHREGAAGKLADQLEQAGFEVVRVDDADRKDYARTRITDRLGSRRARQAVLKLVPGAEVKSAPAAGQADLTIVIGAQ